MQRRTLVGHIARVVVGLLLMATALPPMQLKVMNSFVLMPVFLGVAVIFLPALLWLIRRLCGRYARPVLRLLAAVCIMVLGWLLVSFGVIFAHSFGETPPQDATVVVLGAKVQGKVPTIDLMGRIDAAGTYLRAHPRAFCIATGGKGPEEAITEAESIRDTLIWRHGIDPSRIAMDDTSTNTMQNLHNARTIIRKKGLSTHVALVSDGFHLYRAGIIARRKGLTPYGVPADTDWRLQGYLYLREIFALPKTLLFDR
ncbi:MAG: YdcF family protein [Ethanoligenens sp.]